MDDNIEFVVRGKGSDISNDFLEPIIIPIETHEAKLGLKNFSTYNNIPNVEAGRNNKLLIRVPHTTNFKIFELDTGAYELKIIAQQIYDWIEINNPRLKDVRENFKLIGNEATSKAEFIFKDDYAVDFDVDNGIHELLGFKRTRIFQGIGRYVAGGIVSIVNVTQLIFNCNITTSNYINGKEMPFLYNCGIDVPVAYRLARELTDISYKNLTTSQISRIRIWIVDQDGALVNLQNDDLVVTLSFKLKPKITKVSIEQ